MNIDYLVPQMYVEFDMEAKRNSGGGMMPNVNARKTVLQEKYKVNVVGSVAELTGDFCLVEALWFSQEYSPNISENRLRAMYADRIDKFFETPSTKVVVCSELEMARIPWWARAKIKHFPAGIVVNTCYLWNICVALGITPIGYLCDAVDPHLFKPAPKEMSVVAVGGLKHIKNPYTIFEVFRKLEGTGIKRIYIGNCAIWSNEKREEDMALVKAIKACTDEWIENASYIETAYHLSHAAIGINDTWHDVSSRTNQEMLMAGVVSVGGKHPLFEERVGIHGLETADEFVAVIKDLTEGFTKLPPAEKAKASRAFAIKNFSTEIFGQQFNEIVRSVYL